MDQVSSRVSGGKRGTTEPNSRLPYTTFANHMRARVDMQPPHLLLAAAQRVQQIAGFSLPSVLPPNIPNPYVLQCHRVPALPVMTSTGGRTIVDPADRPYIPQMSAASRAPLPPPFLSTADEASAAAGGGGAIETTASALTADPKTLHETASSIAKEIENLLRDSETLLTRLKNSLVRRFQRLKKGAAGSSDSDQIRFHKFITFHTSILAGSDYSFLTNASTEFIACEAGFKLAALADMFFSFSFHAYKVVASTNHLFPYHFAVLQQHVTFYKYLVTKCPNYQGESAALVARRKRQNQKDIAQLENLIESISKKKQQFDVLCGKFQETTCTYELRVANRYKEDPPTLPHLLQIFFEDSSIPTSQGDVPPGPTLEQTPAESGGNIASIPRVIPTTAEEALTLLPTRTRESFSKIAKIFATIANDLGTLQICAGYNLMRLHDDGFTASKKKSQAFRKFVWPHRKITGSSLDYIKQTKTQIGRFNDHLSELRVPETLFWILHHTNQIINATHFRVNVTFRTLQRFRIFSFSQMEKNQIPIDADTYRTSAQAIVRIKKQLAQLEKEKVRLAKTGDLLEKFFRLKSPPPLKMLLKKTLLLPEATAGGGGGARS